MHPFRSLGMIWPLRMIRPLHPLDFLYLLYAVLMEISDIGAGVEFNSSPYIYRCSRGQTNERDVDVPGARGVRGVQDDYHALTDLRGGLVDPRGDPVGLV